ncbi:MAG: cytochrome b [bacterium]
MHCRNASDRYGIVSKALHWAIAALMFFLIGLGWYMVRLDYYHPWYYSSFAWHQWVGLTVWVLGAWMFVWKFISPSPELPSRIKPSEKFAARQVHRILLAAVILIPMTGVIIVLADGSGLAIGSLVLFSGMDIAEWLENFAVDFHGWVAYAVLVLAAIHGLAALKHQFVNRDGVLRRMLW